jgi:hypothetical protein
VLLTLAFTLAAPTAAHTQGVAAVVGTWSFDRDASSGPSFRPPAAELFITVSHSHLIIRRGSPRAVADGYRLDGTEGVVTRREEPPELRVGTAAVAGGEVVLTTRRTREPGSAMTIVREIYRRSGNRLYIDRQMSVLRPDGTLVRLAGGAVQRLVYTKE